MSNETESTYDHDQLRRDARKLDLRDRVELVYRNEDVPVPVRQRIASENGDVRWSSSLGVRMNQDNTKVFEEDQRREAEREEPSLGIPDAVWARSDQAKIARAKADKKEQVEQEAKDSGPDPLRDAEGRDPAVAAKDRHRQAQEAGNVRESIKGALAWMDTMGDDAA